MQVDVYRNLNKDCLSIRSREQENYGRVIGHTQEVVVAPAEFVVQPAGRERVLEEERKNVHAFVRGELQPETTLRWLKERDVWLKEVTYRPYERGEFFSPLDNEGIDEAEWAYVTTDGCSVPEGAWDDDRDVPVPHMYHMDLDNGGWMTMDYVVFE